MTARPYRALLRLSGAPEDANLQALQGSALPARALSNLGVQYVVTRRARRDLPLALSDPYNVYLVPFSTRRVSFFPQHRIQFLDEVDMIERLGADDFHLANSRQTWLIKSAVEMMRRQDVPITDDFLAQSFAEAGLNEYS